MFRPTYAPISATSAPFLHIALWTRATPVAPQLQTILLTGKSVDGALANGAPVLVILRDVYEVRIVEAAFGLGIGVVGLGKIASISASALALIYGALLFYSGKSYGQD